MKDKGGCFTTIGCLFFILVGPLWAPRLLLIILWRITGSTLTLISKKALKGFSNDLTLVWFLAGKYWEVRGFFLSYILLSTGSSAIFALLPVLVSTLFSKIGRWDDSLIVMGIFCILIGDAGATICGAFIGVLESKGHKKLLQKLRGTYFRALQRRGINEQIMHTDLLDTLRFSVGAPVVTLLKELILAVFLFLGIQFLAVDQLTVFTLLILMIIMIFLSIKGGKSLGKIKHKLRQQNHKVFERVNTAFALQQRMFMRLSTWATQRWRVTYEKEDAAYEELKLNSSWIRLLYTWSKHVIRDTSYYISIFIPLAIAYLRGVPLTIEQGLLLIATGDVARKMFISLRTIGDVLNDLHEGWPAARECLEAIKNFSPETMFSPGKPGEEMSMIIHNITVLRTVRIDSSQQVSPIFESASVKIPLDRRGIYLLLGANGIGKTTLLNLIAGLFKKGQPIVRDKKEQVTWIEGSIEIGQTSNQVDPGLQYLTQKVGFAPGTVRDNIQMGRSIVAQRIDKLVSLLNLDPKTLDREDLESLSGGELRKIGIVRVFADPSTRVILLDEPANDLDMVGVKGLQILLKQFSGTVVLVDHSGKFGDLVTDIIYLPGNGEIVVGSKEKLLQREEVSRFLP